MELEAQVRTYLNYLRVEKGLSDNTIHAYRRDMGKFAAFVAKRGIKMKKISRGDVVDFLSTLYREGLDSRSVARHLASVRHFFRFLLLEEEVSEDPAATIESPKLRQSLPAFLTVAEVDLLLAQPDVSDARG